MSTYTYFFYSSAEQQLKKGFLMAVGLEVISIFNLYNKINKYYFEVNLPLKKK
jgi:hypothetical protein